MILGSEIEISFKEQASRIAIQSDWIERYYLKSIVLNAEHIQIVSGVRRSGKSTLLSLLKREYRKNIASFNFEDSRIYGFEVSDFSKLDKVIGPGVDVYFFDEIQNVPRWEIFIRQLHDRGKKIFITGSNASLLSKELGTRLTGRYISHELFPFNYSEFLVFKKKKDSTSSIESYIKMGGFPEYLKSKNIETLQYLLRDILYRDIAIRYSIKNTKSLFDIALYLMSNVGKEFTFNSLRKAFDVGSANTISDYLHWMEESYLFFYVSKFSYSKKNSSVNPRKVYGIDTGMIQANSLSYTKDKGRLLENLVFLHLRQNQLDIYYYREKKECDFVVFKDKKIVQAIQVCEEVNTDNYQRETEGLLDALEFFSLKKGIIVTKKQRDTLKIGKLTIELIPVNEFILNKRLLVLKAK
ncbi:MAG: ATP-binding protein [Chitinophagales bacterium]|jgi:predicted AAA+ superfamily ATPase|nr:ATP-binding protein [Sphingobacteriales bacterium]